MVLVQLMMDVAAVIAASIVQNSGCCLIGPERVCLVQAWVRRRIAQGGLPRPDSVHLISSTKQFGVKGLLAQLQRDAGVSGDVWVVSSSSPHSPLVAAHGI